MVILLVNCMHFNYGCLFMLCCKTWDKIKPPNLTIGMMAIDSPAIIDAPQKDTLFKWRRSNLFILSQLQLYYRFTFILILLLLLSLLDFFSH